MSGFLFSFFLFYIQYCTDKSSINKSYAHPEYLYHLTFKLKILVNRRSLTISKFVYFVNLSLIFQYSYPLTWHAGDDQHRIQIAFSAYNNPWPTQSVNVVSDYVFVPPA